MRCTGGAGCLDCVTPFSSKMSFDIFIYLLLWFLFFFSCRWAIIKPHCYKTAGGTVLEWGLRNRSECGFLLTAESPQPQSDGLDGSRKWTSLVSLPPVNIWLFSSASSLDKMCRNSIMESRLHLGKTNTEYSLPSINVKKQNVVTEDEEMKRWIHEERITELMAGWTRWCRHQGLDTNAEKRSAAVPPDCRQTALVVLE